MSRWLVPIAFGAATILAGCGGHTARTLQTRVALNDGRFRDAIRALNEELEVQSDGELPKKLEGDNSLLVLDRASIQQALVQFPQSRRDFEAADKAIDMLDLARNAGDDIGRYIFSDSVGRYKAPPYEKLLINTLNMINYLAVGDLSGARVEARRLSVITRYYKDQLKETDNAVLSLGGMLAGFTFEKSGETDEALHYYDDALAFANYGALRDSVGALLPLGGYSTQNLRKAIERAAPILPLEKTGMGELVVLVGYGRVPHKISNRVPIGLALTYVSGLMAPNDVAAANRLAASGLVTWVNFPTLAPDLGPISLPLCSVDGQTIPLEEAVDVSRQVRTEWKKLEGQIILSAITRLIARSAVGAGVQAAGRDSGWGFLASLAVQGTLTALDTPDTRSWETLPARVTLARIRLNPGRHRIVLQSRGMSRNEDVVIEKGGWTMMPLMALR